MPLITQRIVRGLTPFLDPYMTPATRLRPEKIILGVKPGHRPSPKPPVRIFLGSERKQFRAERVFIWSVEKHRDPSRIYEIHLLKGLRGWVSGFWITGFTNYRFAIPYFCDYQGRAIYNDVDQVWLTDPAALFDREMNSAGFLAINDHDTSVMLLDCARMRPVWNRESVHRTTRKRLEARARSAKLWGALEGRYNARDAEHVPGESACVHFTTLHTQPWRPFPDWFVYDDNPTGALWPDLEAEADAAGFLPVTAMRPSSAWPDAMLALTARPDGAELSRLLGPQNRGLRHVERREIEGLLERVPDADLAWVLDRLFELSDELTVRIDEPRWIRTGRPRRPLHFWIEQFRMASGMHPKVRWRMEHRIQGRRRRVFEGGPLPEGAVISVVGEDADSACRAFDAAEVAERIGKHLGRTVRRIRPAELSAQNQPLNAAVLVAYGRQAIAAARRHARHVEHPPRLVLLGRQSVPVPEHGAVALNLRHNGLPPHPDRITSLLGVTPALAVPDADGPADLPWRGRSSRAAVLVGAREGGWKRDGLETLANAAGEWAARSNRALLVLTTPATAGYATTLRRLLGDDAEVYAWRENDAENPFGAALDEAHALLVAGQEQTLMRMALTSGKPVSLLPERPCHGLFDRLRGRIAERAFRPSYNKRGSIRPQQGRSYLSARLIERGYVLPPTGAAEWQQTLVESGLATWIGSSARPGTRYTPETDALINAIVDRLQPDRSSTASTHASAIDRKR